MQIPVLIEPVDGNGYRAQPFPFTAQGATPEEALQKLRELLEGRISSGAKIVQMEILPKDDPRRQMVGIWDPNDPDIKEWRQAMEEYREKVEQDPDYL
jgi:predicted RNase H-like HicB family nuclease